MDQLIIPKLIFSFILITYLVDIVVILKGEILFWSLMEVKGLNSFSTSSSEKDHFKAYPKNKLSHFVKVVRFNCVS